MSGADYGLVYVYRWDGIRWSEESRLRQPSPQAGDGLGGGVWLDGDTLVTGRGANNDVYRWSGATWTRQAQLPRGPVSLDGDVLALGQPSDASGNGQPGDTSAPASGAVRVFTRSGSNWTETAYLKASPPQANAYLGSSVALERNVLVTSASGTHMLHVFQRVGGNWVASPPLAPSGASTAASAFGPVALTSIGAVVADSEDNGPAGATPSSGTAWFFR